MALQGSISENISTSVDLNVIKLEPVDSIHRTLESGQTIFEENPCSFQKFNITSIKHEPINADVNRTERMVNHSATKPKSKKRRGRKNGNPSEGKPKNNTRKNRKKQQKKQAEREFIRIIQLIVEGQERLSNGVPNSITHQDKMNHLNKREREELGNSISMEINETHNKRRKRQHTQIDQNVSAQTVQQINCAPNSLKQTENSEKRYKKRKENIEQDQLLCHQDMNVQNRTLIIKGISESLSYKEILEYISKYGNVLNYYFRGDNQYAIIQVLNSPSINQLPIGRHILNGIKLDIRFLPNSYKGIASNCLNFKEIYKTLKQFPNFQSKLNQLVEELQLSLLTKNYKLLCSDLQNILRAIFPCCAVFLFGAADCDLSLSTSLVDVHVELNNPEVLSDSDTIEKCNELLKNRKIVFSDIPLGAGQDKIECIHNPTKLKCCIYFNKRQNVLSTALTQFYLSFNPKLKPLMVIIKYWAKIHNLTDSFSSYSLILLFIFFIQQRPCCLPPVMFLETVQDSPELNKFGIQTFQAPKPLQVKIPHPSIFSIPNLLYSFFDYYAKFDYTRKIISPYLGKPDLKSEFCNTEEIPIFVQNPFSFDNATELVCDRGLNKFVGLCRVAAAIINHRRVDDLALYKLFTDPNMSLQEYINGPSVHVKLEPELAITENMSNISIYGTTKTESVLENDVANANHSSSSFDCAQTPIKSEPLQSMDERFKNIDTQSQTNYIYPLLDVRW